MWFYLSFWYFKACLTSTNWFFVPDFLPIFISCSFSFYNFAISWPFEILCTSKLTFFVVFKGDFFLYDALRSPANGLLLSENIASSLDWWCLVDSWMLDNWPVEPKYLKGSKSWRLISKFCFLTLSSSSSDKVYLLYLEV
jgi:hypothetical protein